MNQTDNERVVTRGDRLTEFRGGSADVNKLLLWLLCVWCRLIEGTTYDVSEITCDEQSDAAVLVGVQMGNLEMIHATDAFLLLILVYPYIVVSTGFKQ